MKHTNHNFFSKIVPILRQSLNNEERDYTHGSIRKAVVLLAIPMILELGLEGVFALVDIFFVSKLGPNAIATVGLTESVITIVYSIAIGLSISVTALIARRVGEKNYEAAAYTSAQTLLVSVFITVLTTIVGVIYAGDILSLMGASAEVVSEGTSFTRIMFSGSAAIMLLFIINGIFRGAGNAAMAMRSLWVASIINIILCPLFINLYGLKGAAIATVIGRSTGVFYQCYHLFRGHGYLKVSRHQFLVNKEIIISIIAISWPATLQFLIASGSWIVLARLVAETGETVASAGYQIAVRNFVFFILPGWGLSNAAATLVGQNLGANQIDRAKKSVQIVTMYNSIFMGCVMILFLFGASPIISFFTQEKEIAHFGILSLQIISSGYIFYGIGMLMTQALNGAGDTRTPTIINLVGFWLFQIPLGYFLAYGLQFQAVGAIIAIPIAESFIGIVAWYYFKKGKWKSLKI